ncbi:DUF2157 domain-containing protein [Niveispirillum lacus]|nr:DUF2157 domain-containing protein [Niveispirillum lacus]
MGPVFGLQGKLADWQRDGIIDADQAERIATYEAGRSRPRLALALAVLGAFTIGVGVIAIIAANWDAIPIALRLGLHMALNLVLGTAAWVWTRSTGPEPSVRGEGAVLLLSLSTLALIAHIGQSFQLQGSAAGLLGGWLLLATPFIVRLSRGGINRWVWTGGLFAWMLFTLDEHHRWLSDKHLLSTFFMLFLAVLSALRADRLRLPPVWARHLGQVAAGAAILGTSIMLMIVAPLMTRPVTEAARHDVLIGAGVGLVALAAAHLLVPADRRGARLGLGVAVALAPALFALPLLFTGTTGAIIAGVAFCLYWIGLARLALVAGRPGWYRLAVVLIAVRVFVAYLDAAGGLMATGLGLILAGLVLLGLAYAAWRMMEWRMERPV